MATLTRIPGELAHIATADDSFWGIHDTPNGMVMRGGGSPFICTNYALAIRDLIGPSRVRIFGFSRDQNPTSDIARYFGGHDFAVVDTRWIVDPWLRGNGYSTDTMCFVGVPVFDLLTRDPLVKILYGDQNRWISSL